MDRQSPSLPTQHPMEFQDPWHQMFECSNSYGPCPRFHEVTNHRAPAWWLRRCRIVAGAGLLLLELSVFGLQMLVFVLNLGHRCGYAASRLQIEKNFTPALLQFGLILCFQEESSMLFF